MRQEKRSSTFHVKCLDAQARADMTDVGTGSCSSRPSPGAVYTHTRSRAIPATGERALHGLKQVISPCALEAFSWQHPDLLITFPQADSPWSRGAVVSAPTCFEAGGRWGTEGAGNRGLAIRGAWWGLRHLPRLGRLTWACWLAGGSATLDRS